MQCLEEMLRSFSNAGKFNLHINVPYGINAHHTAEAIFKALGQALGSAVKIKHAQRSRIETVSMNNQGGE